MTTSPLTVAQQVVTLSAQPEPLAHRLPLPQTEPPFDDELPPPGRPPHSYLRPLAHPAVVGHQEALALSFLLPSGLPARPECPVDLLAAAHDGVELDDDTDFAPQPTPRALLPEPRNWVARLVQAVLEVFAGDRPASQLVRWTSEDVYLRVQQRAGRGAPPGRCNSGRAVVRSVHVTEPADGVAEACARVQRGVRAGAVALRLEGVDGRWQCTALEVH